MKNLDIILCIFLVPALAFGQKKPDSSFTVKINMTSIRKATQIYLAYQIDGKKIIDSAKKDTVHGIYTLTGKVVKPAYATLVADTDNLGLEGLIRKTKAGGAVDLLQIYLHPGIIRISTDHLISQGKFTGSVINSDNQKLQILKKHIRDKQLAISMQLRQTTDKDVAHRLGIQLDSLADATKPILKKFVLENPHSFIALLALQEYAGTFPNLAEIEPMFNKLSPDVKSITTAKEYHKFLTDIRLLNAGTKAPEFEQNDTIGKPVSLSSFNGKYVLLDFWASWCGPCRQDNPSLRQIYHDFKDRKFTILGISLDGADGKKLWLQAIKDDALTWTQVSDLKHWDNKVAKLYSVRYIPQSFLIDPDGIIIAKGLNHDELRKKLEQVLPPQ